jgi:hypothetical protein
MSNEKLKEEFNQAMFDIYRRAYSEANYKASRFLEMLYEHQGVDTARILINSKNVSEGYTALWELGRIDLTVEAVIYDNPNFQPLFSSNELAICKKRLKDYGYI